MANTANLKPFNQGYDARRGSKPKGVRHLSTIIQEVMNDDEFTAQILDGYTLVEYKGIPAKAIVRVAILKAIGGDVRWAEWLAKNGWGKIDPQPFETASRPIQFICNVPVSD